jgi:quercetin dioxygenase-like cupin family protein
MSRKFLVVLVIFVSANAADRPPVKCAADSPERHGEEGCSILASRPLVGSTAEPLYWHIDRFDSLDAASNAAGPDSVAAHAHGSVWLMTIERHTQEHHGGSHIASIGPLPLPAADRYTMRVHSTLLNPGSATPVHSHSGPEVWYIVSGEQCLETQQISHRLIAGQSFVLPSDLMHRGRITATVPRGALALVLHDAARPPSTDFTTAPSLSACK